VYRYVIVGGDSARDANGNFYPQATLNADGIPWLVSTQTIPDASPFMIVSKATTCRSATGKSEVLVDALNPATLTCNTGTRDELTVLTATRLLREQPGVVTPKDKVDQTLLFKDSTQIRLPSSAQVPNYGWINANANTPLDFERMWTNAATPFRLTRVVFYNFSTNQVIREVPIAGTLTNITATPVPAKAVIRLYFDSPIDHRSISPDNTANLTSCRNTPATCRIRVMQRTAPAGTGGTAYAGNAMIPLLPGSNQVILLPPLSGTLTGGNNPHAIRVQSNQMRTFNNVPGALDYTIVFTVN